MHFVSFVNQFKKRKFVDFFELFEFHRFVVIKIRWKEKVSLSGKWPCYRTHLPDTEGICPSPTGS